MHQSGDRVAKLRSPPMNDASERGNDDDAARGEVAVDAFAGIAGASPAPARAQRAELDFVVVTDPCSRTVLGWIVERRVDGQVATHRQPASHPS